MENLIVFVSGGNRGIGSGIVAQFLQHGHTVIAGYRSAEKSQELLKLENSALYPFKIDVTDESDCADLHDFIADRFGRLDVVINNAAILIDRNVSLNDLDVTDLSLTFNVNVGGTHLVTKSLYPLLQKGTAKRIANISSKYASLALNDGGTTAYRISKAAVNMLTTSQALDYAADKITAVAIDPGWVQTDMGGSSATLTIESSSSQIVEQVLSLTHEQTGQFIRYNGEALPW